MALEYFTYPGFGQNLSAGFGYSQCVRIQDFIKCSGQGSWNENGQFASNLDSQIDQAYINVNTALRSAGSLGWEQVYSTRKFVRSMDTPTLDAIGRNLAKWTPEHNPLMTIVEGHLWEDMAIEIEVEAYLGIPGSNHA